MYLVNMHAGLFVCDSTIAVDTNDMTRQIHVVINLLRYVLY